MGDVLGYVRASPGDPDPRDQRLRLERAGARQVFEDVRSSGKATSKPGLQTLLSRARPGDTLAVVRLDRLGGSLRELLTTIAMLREGGITLLSLDECLDTSAVAGELVFRVFNAIACFERQLTAERMGNSTAGLIGNRHQSRQQGDPDTVATAIKLVEMGLSATQVAKQLELDSVVICHEMALAAARKGGA